MVLTIFDKKKKNKYLSWVILNWKFQDFTWKAWNISEPGVWLYLSIKNYSPCHYRKNTTTLMRSRRPDVCVPRFRRIVRTPCEPLNLPTRFIAIVCRPPFFVPLTFQPWRETPSIIFPLSFFAYSLWRKFVRVERGIGRMLVFNVSIRIKKRNGRPAMFGNRVQGWTFSPLNDFCKNFLYWQICGF